jgi:BirA family biotin operon repressor/biotin-[acetyl-CoA-carboxylase] ligase
MERLQQLMAEAEAKGEVLAGGTVVVADTLHRSTGRFERSWHAPEGGLWMAMAWPDILLPEFSRLLPFAVGLACCRTIRSYRLDCRLKWVNDVLVNGKKIGGILCETVLRPAGDRYHLLGIGLNGNNRDFPAALPVRATSIAGESGSDVDLAELTGRLLAELNWALGLLHYDEECCLQTRQGCEQGRGSLLLSSWQQLCDSMGRRVQYGFDVFEHPLYQADVTGVDPCGGLIMELQDGSSITEYSGEILYI